MPVPTPQGDPNWAYDTLGWTNQGNTGDVPTTGASNGVVSPYDAELSGVLASTMDSGSAVTAAFTPATGIFYGGLIYLGGSAKSTKYFASVSAAGTTTHAYVALLSPAGATLATSADLTTLSTATGSWATAPVLSAGFYYLGLVTTWSVLDSFAGIANAAMLCGNAPGLTYSGTGQGVLPKFVTSTAALTITSSFPASVTLTAQTTGAIGAPYIALF